MYIYEAIIQLNIILVPIPVVIMQRKCSVVSCRPPGEHYHGYKWNSHVVMDSRIMPTKSYICTYYIDNHIETSDTRPKRIRLVGLERNTLYFPVPPNCQDVSPVQQR